MDTYELYKLQLAKNKVTSILARVVIALGIAFISGNGLPAFIAFYSLISWYWIFVRITGNWLLGAIFGLIAVFAVGAKIESTGSTIGMYIFIFVLIFGLAIIDIVNFIKYIVLKSNIQKNHIQIRKLSREEMRSYRTETEEDNIFKRLIELHKELLKTLCNFPSNIF